jgi:hypothetical protein
MGGPAEQGSCSGLFALGLCPPGLGMLYQQATSNRQQNLPRLLLFTFSWSEAQLGSGASLWLSQISPSMLL